jgi:hypothetical protein
MARGKNHRKYNAIHWCTEKREHHMVDDTEELYYQFTVQYTTRSGYKVSVVVLSQSHHSHNHVHPVSVGGWCATVP